MTMRRHWRTMAIYKPRRGISEEIDPADILISSLQKCEKVIFCNLSLLICGTLWGKLYQTTAVALATAAWLVPYQSSAEFLSLSCSAPASFCGVYKSSTSWLFFTSCPSPPPLCSSLGICGFLSYPSMGWSLYLCPWHWPCFRLAYLILTCSFLLFK